MTQQTHPQPRELSPHLAAAALWITKGSRTTPRGKNTIPYARAFGSRVDDFLAL